MTHQTDRDADTPAGVPDAGVQGPLAGLRVLDLSTTPAGAICSMLLADQGATVLLVEQQEGHPLRRASAAPVWLRGKRSLALAREDAATLSALYAEADVLLVGSPDGGPPAFALPDRASSPRLVICAVGGPIGQFSGDDDLLAAATGIMGKQPGFRPGPTYVLPPLSTYAAATLAVHGIGAALFARERDGRGDYVEVPLLAGSLFQQCAQLAEVEHPGPLGALRRTPYGQLPLYRLYQCQDGRFLHLGLINTRFWPKLCVAIDRPELLSDPRFQSPVRFTSHEERRALMDILAATFVRRPYGDWDRLFDEHDVPCAPACTADEFAHDSQVLARRAVVTVDDPELGPTRQTGLAILFAGGPVAPAGPPPGIGQHNRDPWGNVAPLRARQTAKPPAEPSKGKVSRGPLAGVRILDLSAYIAGPLGPALLADLGADVIKVEGPDGEGLRGNHAGFIAWNRGKRCISVDLRRDEGREVVHRLAATADVVVENMRPGVADRLGVGHAALAALNPRLIYCYVSAYGRDGPYRHRPGVDPLMQARSGIERAQGGHERPPVFLLVPVTDNTCAALNAAGVALALYRRERTGQGCYLETSLLQAAAFVQSDQLLAYAGRRAPRVNDFDQAGPGPLRRLYQCADGWIYLSAGWGANGSADSAHWPALCAALGRTELTGDPRFATRELRCDHPHDLADELTEAFARMPLQETLRRLVAADVPAVEAVDGFADRFHAALAATDPALLTTYLHPTMGTVTQPGVLVRFADRPGAVPGPAPLLGEHTEPVLRELGFAPERIAALLDAGIIVGVARS